MDIQALLQRAVPTSGSLLTGEWATLGFRPDLGSQQEFIVGVAAAMDGESALRIQWLPSLQKLSHLYGDALTSADTRSLFNGVETAAHAHPRRPLRLLDTGSPQLRIVSCGYLATDDPDVELTVLLKRQAGALWHDPAPRDVAMDDDWAYSQMARALAPLQRGRSPFIAGRCVTVGGEQFKVGLDNGRSFGNVVSARYASFDTVAGHIHAARLALELAQAAARRAAPPALFVVLPEPDTSSRIVMIDKTAQLLDAFERVGVAQFRQSDPAKLAELVGSWAELSA